MKDETVGVKILLGEPKTALLRLALPMIMAMFFITLYNVVDAFWVAGLGPVALAAVGYVFPFQFAIMGIGNGIGIGGGSAVSRLIGMNEKERAENTAMHTILIMIVSSVLITIPLYIASAPIFELMGASEAAAGAAAYGSIIFLGTPIIIFSGVGYSLLRAEGDAKRAMYAIIAASLLNIVLDPIFIYTFDMGVAGAAWASNLAMLIPCLMMIWWMGIKKNTFVRLSVSSFHADRMILHDILNVGIPASAENLAIAVKTFALNLILTLVAGTAGVAILTAGWRVVCIALIPLVGIATAVVSVVGAGYGARVYGNIRIAHLYSIKIGLAISVCITVAIIALAPEIAGVFTATPGGAAITGDLILFLLIVSLFFPSIPFGMFSTSLFHGVGKGTTALFLSMLRALILNIIFSWFFAVTLGMGIAGVWWGLVAGNYAGDGIAFIWAWLYTKHLIRIYGADSRTPEELGKKGLF